MRRRMPLHGARLATGATARPTRTSWVQISLRARYRPIRTSRILPDVILTLVHSTRLLPWVVKIMSVPRSVSRAIPRPPLAVQKVAGNRLEPLTTVAPSARRQQTRATIDREAIGCQIDDRRAHVVHNRPPSSPLRPVCPLCPVAVTSVKAICGQRRQSESGERPRARGGESERAHLRNSPLLKIGNNLLKTT